MQGNEELCNHCGLVGVVSSLLSRWITVHTDALFATVDWLTPSLLLHKPASTSVISGRASAPVQNGVLSLSLSSQSHPKAPPPPPPSACRFLAGFELVIPLHLVVGPLSV